MRSVLRGGRAALVGLAMAAAVDLGGGGLIALGSLLVYRSARE